jgi:shikimate dehydrogenase
MELYGLVGKTLVYSFSRNFFEKLFTEQRIEAEYRNFELKEIEQIRKVFELDPSGLNVTIPYKESIIPYLDDFSDEVKEIGAVNVVQFNAGKKIGHNTDAYGFHQMIKPFLTNKHERAIIIGTGGASKAIHYVFANIGIDCIYISRNPTGENQFHYHEINDHMLKACKVIVNCTPVGTFPDSNANIDFPFHYLTEEHLVIDLIYNPPKTNFLLD